MSFLGLSLPEWARTAESRHRGSAAVATCGGAEIHDRGNPPLIRVR